MEFKELFMLCNSTDEVKAKNFDVSRFKAQVKYDGERVISVVLGNDVIMVNRRGNILNFKFRDVEEELKQLPNCIIDGEIISEDDDFNKLQRRALTKNASMIKVLMKEIKVNYMVFDIIKLGDDTLMGNPLSDRVEKLKGLFKDKNFNILKYADYGEIDEMLNKAKTEEREGIIIKDMKGRYENKRSDNWLKLKFFQETTITINKYEENNKGIRGEDSLGNAVQIAGSQSEEVKRVIDLTGGCEIYIQYLTKSEETNRFRFPSFRGMVK